MKIHGIGAGARSLGIDSFVTGDGLVLGRPRRPRSATATHPRFTWQAALARALIGTLGGLVAAFCFMVGFASMLTAAGAMTRADAGLAAAMLAFLVWVAAVLVAFASASVPRAAGWVFGSAAGFALLGWASLL